MSFGRITALGIAGVLALTGIIAPSAAFADSSANVRISAPANGSTHAGGRIEFAGTGQPGALITLSTGKLADTTRVGADGSWSMTTSLGAVDRTYSATQVASGSPTTTASVSLVAPSTAIPLQVTNPAAGSTVVAPSKRQKVTGTGAPRASVAFREDGNVLVSGTVGSGGAWELTLPTSGGTHDYVIDYTPAGAVTQSIPHPLTVIGPK
jgi:large repetitive protein